MIVVTEWHSKKPINPPQLRRSGILAGNSPARLLAILHQKKSHFAL